MSRLYILFFILSFSNCADAGKLLSAAGGITEGVETRFRLSLLRRCAGLVVGSGQNWPEYFLEWNDDKSLVQQIRVKGNRVWGMSVTSTELLQNGEAMVRHFPDLEQLTINIYGIPTAKELVGIFQSPLLKHIKYLKVKTDFEGSRFSQLLSRLPEVQSEAYELLLQSPVHFPKIVSANLSGNFLYPEIYELLLTGMPELQAVDLTRNVRVRADLPLDTKTHGRVLRLKELVAEAPSVVRYLNLPSTTLRELTITGVDEPLMKEFYRLRGLDRVAVLSMVGDFSESWRFGPWDRLPLAASLTSLDVEGGTLGLNFTHAVASAKMSKVQNLSVSSTAMASDVLVALGAAFPEVEDLRLANIKCKGAFVLPRNEPLFPKAKIFTLAFKSPAMAKHLLQDNYHFPTLEKLSLWTARESRDVDKIATEWAERGINLSYDTWAAPPQ